MIIDITNEVVTAVKNACPEAQVSSSYPKKVGKFPLITIDEIVNSTYEDSVDSSGENHSEIAFEINIFSTSKTPVGEVGKLRKKVDAILADAYGLSRESLGRVPNFSDTNVYRYTVRYDGVINKNKTIFRR